MKTSTCVIATALLAAAGGGTAAAERPDAPLARRAAEQFIARESAGLPGRVTYVVGALDPQLALPVCRSLDAFLPPGGRLWGSTTIGVRCTAPAPWIVYLPAAVHVWSGVVQSARTITQGQPIVDADLRVQQADLTALPSGVVTDVNAARGKALVTTLQPGQPLRVDLLRAPTVVQQGQPVKLTVKGAGFVVTAEGRALTAAADGQLVQVRVPSGLVVSGLARSGATVEVRP